MCAFISAIYSKGALLHTKIKNGDVSDVGHFRHVHSLQLSPNYLNVTFHPAFHHLLPPLTTSLALRCNVGSTCVCSFTQTICIILCKQSRVDAIGPNPEWKWTRWLHWHQPWIKHTEKPLFTFLLKKSIVNYEVKSKISSTLRR